MDAKKTGAFIASLRKEQKLTQAALAERLNLSNRTVSKWETGDGYPDITVLPKLSQILGVSVDELLSGERQSSPIPEVKVTEVENGDHLKNLFSVMYVIALFFALLAAVLGTLTELYCIWAFSILFYTHWEIIFAAMSFFATLAAGLIYCVGLVRLEVAFSKDEIRQMTRRKTWALSLILTFFPVAFLIRLYRCFFWHFQVGFAVLLCLLCALGLIILYKKLRR